MLNARDQLKDYLSLIIWATLLHEISHAVVNHLFDGKTTPKGAGLDPHSDTHGESGFLMEEMLFGYRFAAIFPKSDYPNMRKIERLIAMVPRNDREFTDYILSESFIHSDFSFDW